MSNHLLLVFKLNSDFLNCTDDNEIRVGLYEYISDPSLNFRLLISQGDVVERKRGSKNFYCHGVRDSLPFLGLVDFSCGLLSVCTTTGLVICQNININRIVVLFGC